MIDALSANGTDLDSPDFGSAELGSADLSAFLNGAIRERMGLRSDDLLVGLDVARTHMLRGAPRDALQVYSVLVLCEPLNVEFQVALAECLLQLDDVLLASQAASLAISLAPADPRGYYLSAQAYLGLGLTAEAQDDLNEAITRGIAAREATLVEDARRLLTFLTHKAPDRAATASAAAP